MKAFDLRQFNALSDAVKGANALQTRQFVSLAEVNQASLRFYTELGIGNLKTLGAVRSPADMTEFTKTQIDVARTVMRRMVNDTLALVQLNHKNWEEWQALEKTTKKAA